MKRRKAIWFLLIMAATIISGCSKTATVTTDRQIITQDGIGLIKNGKPYVLRFRSEGQENKRIFFDDIIRGKIEMPENIIDEVLLKSDGIPTYHFAHACDDHFMRTTHVIRAEEWLSSVPKHIAIFKACGFRVPKYAHLSNKV